MLFQLQGRAGAKRGKEIRGIKGRRGSRELKRAFTRGKKRKDTNLSHHKTGKKEDGRGACAMGSYESSSDDRVENSRKGKKGGCSGKKKRHSSGKQTQE